MPNIFAMVEEMAAPKKEVWKSRGERAMVKGKFSICMYGYKPNEDYALFGSGPEMLAHGKTYQEMIDIAEKAGKK